MAIKQVTIDGIKIKVDMESLDDFELMEDIAEVDSGNLVRVVSVVRRLIGDDYKDVIEALRGENGRVSASKVSDFVVKLMGKLNPNS